jgi:acetyl-CoA acetyltransferase
MKYADAAIPIGAVWSSPFAKWQGTLAEVDSLDLATAVTSRALADRSIDRGRLTGLVLGWTVPHKQIFYGPPTLAARIGSPELTGPMVAVNDLWFCRETGVKPENMNAYGCSLVFGHPQGPTGLRSIAELSEILRLRGGGVGLFTGCAAGDTGAALVLEVTDR